MHPDYKFKQKYNPKSNRLQDFNYGSNGGYFITICTKDRQNYFGEIIDGEMILNNIGKIVYDDIVSLEKHFDYIKIDEFIIMPNHLHLIIVLSHNDDLNCCRDISCKDVSCRDVSQKHLYGNNDEINKHFSNISPKKGTIGNIIKLFKGFSSKKINKSQNKIFFAWQPNYYDRIIRNEDELNKIRKYIVENPLKRELDKNNAENIFM